MTNIQTVLYNIPFRRYEAVRAYVVRSLVNKRTDYARGDHATPDIILLDAVEAPSDVRSPDEAAMSRERFEAVLESIDALDNDDAAVAHGRLVRGQTWADLARRLGGNPDALRMQFDRRILPALRHRLTARGVQVR